MIVWYDLLMLDDESLLSVRQSERFRHLKSLVTCVAGRSMLVKRRVIDCSKQSAASELRRAFGRCITQGKEGLVLKPDCPYFDFDGRKTRYSPCCIKMKKGYVKGFGDIGDFAVVGARYDATKAKTIPIPGLKWTHFYVACLENKEEVARFGKKPKFVVTNVVEMSATNTKAFLAFVRYANLQTTPASPKEPLPFRIEPGVDGQKRPSTIFSEPYPVVDLSCHSFDKPGNTGGFWSPRFPVVTKIHRDRSIQDVMTFGDLQEMANTEMTREDFEDSQELLHQMSALESADARGFAMDTDTEDSDADSQHSNATSTSDTLLRTAVRDLITPPTSSASEPRHRDGPENRPESVVSNGSKRKQSDEQYCTTTLQGNKAQKCFPSQSPAASTPTTESSPSQSQREPLTDVATGSARRNSGVARPVPRLVGVSSMHQLPTLSKEIEPTETLRRVQTSMPGSLSFQEIPSGTPPASSPADVANHTQAASASSPGHCRYCPDTCLLSTYSILVSPCVASFPWLTEDLFSRHGVTSFIRDPKEWITEGNRSNDSSGDNNAAQAKRRKKIALVDRRRQDATILFLKSIESLELKFANGNPEWVEVYDWRVLEQLTSVEQKLSRDGEKPGVRGPSLLSVGQIWRKWVVGLA
jgi:DNA ligase 4